MRTQAGKPCPYNPAEAGEYVALYPMKDGARIPEGLSGPGVVPADSHAIGRTAYLEQWVEMYPDAPAPELPPAKEPWL